MSLTVLLPALVVGALVVLPLAAAADVRVSTELITRPGQLAALTSGSSAAAYGVALPGAASCPGDTTHQGYHVFSYLVPQGVSPTAVSFKTGVPNKYFGYIAEGSYFGAVNTAEQTGRILGLPSQFTWTRLTPQDLFTGGATSAVWEGGIACADTHGTVTNYWNSEVRFSADRSDPGGFTWAVLHNSPSTTTSGSTDIALWVGLGLLVLAAGSAAVYVLSRRAGRGRQTPLGPGARSVSEGAGSHLVDAKGS